MIHSLIHPGSGLGNQLFRIVAGKVLALDKGYEYAAIGRENFKGASFMNLDMGEPSNQACHLDKFAGRLAPILSENGKIKMWNETTNYYNPEFNFIEDNTIIDGEFQDQRYFEHRMGVINKWLAVEPINIPEDVCVIGFRGGEFYLYPELGLPEEYFNEGIRMMREINPDMKFEVHTDDEALAKQAFPNFPVIQNIGINWTSIRYANYAIIANSSFYILPRLLNHFDNPFSSTTIAPRYWARRNTKEWSMPANFYKSFQHI